MTETLPVSEGRIPFGRAETWYRIVGEGERPGALVEGGQGLAPPSVRLGALGVPLGVVDGEEVGRDRVVGPGLRVGRQAVPGEPTGEAVGRPGAESVGNLGQPGMEHALALAGRRADRVVRLRILDHRVGEAAAAKARPGAAPGGAGFADGEGAQGPSVHKKQNTGKFADGKNVDDLDLYFEKAGTRSLFEVINERYTIWMTETRVLNAE